MTVLKTIAVRIGRVPAAKRLVAATEPEVLTNSERQGPFGSTKLGWRRLGGGLMHACL